MEPGASPAAQNPQEAESEYETSSLLLDDSAQCLEEQVNTASHPEHTQTDIEAEATGHSEAPQGPLQETSIPAVEANTTYQKLMNVTLKHGHGKGPGLESDDYECSICLMIIKDDEVVLGHTECSLQVHAGCILDEWLEKNHRCPHCQRPLREPVPAINEVQRVLFGDDGEGYAALIEQQLAAPFIVPFDTQAWQEDPVIGNRTFEEVMSDPNATDQERDRAMMRELG